MTRGLSAAAKAYASGIHWTVDITATDGTVYYYWTGEGNRVIDGNTYLPYLRITSGFRHTRSLQVDAGEIELDGTDLSVQTALASKTFAGGLCVVKQYLWEIGTRVHVMRGRLSEEERRVDGTAWRVVAEFEPSEIDALGLKFSALCPLRFGKPPCGYIHTSVDMSTNLSEQTADIFSPTTIGKASLTMTVNEHIDRVVMISAGTGKGQHRRVISNTATTLALYQAWTTTPDGTSKFRVCTGLYGLPKQLFTATSSVFGATADIFTSRTIGYTGLSMTVDEHASTAGDETAGLVWIYEGTGVGQTKRIKGNTATTVTIADDETAFSPVPDATSKFRVLYARCPKDIASACEQRGRTQRFAGAPTVSPLLTKLYGT